MFIIFMGVSGCGKTTIGKMTAAFFGVHFYEGDDYHPPENIKKMAAGLPLTDEDRAGWLDVLAQLMRHKLDQGQSGVLSCSALKKKYRDGLRADKDRIHFIYLKGSQELIRSRIEERTGHYMPAELLKSQFEALEEPCHALTIDVAQSPDEILARVVTYLEDLGFNPS